MPLDRSIEEKLRQLVPPSVSEAGLKRMDSTIEQLARAASPGAQAASASATANRKGIWRAAAVLALLLVPAALLTARAMLSGSAQANAQVANHAAESLGASDLDQGVATVAGNYSWLFNDQQVRLPVLMNIRISPDGCYSGRGIDGEGGEHFIKGKGSKADIKRAFVARFRQAQH